MTGKTTLNAENLSAGYSVQEIVKSISCSFTSGTFTGIIGPNRSGKTTLLRNWVWRSVLSRRTRDARSPTR